jgi:hypothetical protein
MVGVHVIAVLAIDPILCLGHSGHGPGKYYQDRAKGDPVWLIEDIPVIHPAVQEHSTVMTQSVQQVIIEQSVSSRRRTLPVIASGIGQPVKMPSGHDNRKSWTSGFVGTRQIDISPGVLYDLRDLTGLYLQRGSFSAVSKLCHNLQRISLLENQVQDVKRNPSSFIRPKRVTTLLQAVLCGISLPLHLLKGGVSEVREDGSSEKCCDLQKRSDPFTALLGRLGLCLGAAIFGYCYWQAKFRIDNLLYLWLTLTLCGLLLFMYGFGVLVERSLESV